MRRRRRQNVREACYSKRNRLDSDPSSTLSRGADEPGDSLPGPSGGHGHGGRTLISDSSEEEIADDEEDDEEDDDDDDDDDDVEDILKQLPERFKNSEIVLEQIGSKAMGICVVQQEQYSYIIDYARCQSVVPMDYKKKWTKPKDKKSAERLNEFTRILRQRAKFLVFDPDAMEWKKKKEIKKLKIMQSTKGIAQKGKKRTKKPDKRKKTLLKKKMKYTRNTFVDKLIDDLRLDLKIAFLYKMHNSKGCDFMRNLLASAGYVCFGKNYKDSVSILGVGTSPYNPEGVRVNVHSATYKLPKQSEDELGEEEKSNEELSGNEEPKKDIQSSGKQRKGSDKQRQDDSEKKRSIQRWVDEAVSYKSSSCCARSSGKSSSSIYPSVKAGYVYPDVVVTSMSGDFAKYIMVVDMKSVSLQASELEQIRKQMVGAGIHQSEVFGIIMNWEEARILRMTVQKQDRKVTFTEECFQLIRATGDPPDRIYEVNEDDLCEFFVYLVAIIDYGFEHILEVKYE